MVTGLESDIVLEGVELAEDRFDVANRIIRSGAGHLYNVLFKDEKVKPKVTTLLNRQYCHNIYTVFHIAIFRKE